MQTYNPKRIFLSVLMLISMSAFADPATLTQAKALMDAGNYKAAYALLEPLEADLGGDIQYDILFGSAAIESGEAARGVFALERVLEEQPQNVEARVLIAKGYYKSGENENAKKEFTNVLAQKPNTDLARVIENNLISIDKATGQASTFAAFLDFGLGHDSNINSATSVEAINILAANILIPLTANSREQSSNFVSVAGGLSARVPLSKNVSAFASLSGSNKVNWATSDFDFSSLDYSVGISARRHIDTFTLALQGGSFAVDGDTFREAIGLNGQWQRNLSDKDQVSVYGQFADFDYQGTNQIRDAKRYVGGGAWSHSFDGDKAKVGYISAYTGQENTDDSTFDFLSYDLYGVRLGGQMAIHYKLVAYANASYEKRNYDETDPFFLIKRDDKQYDFNIGLKYLPGYGFTIRPQLSYTDNRSNNNLFEFDRYIVSINVRKDFNW